MQLLFGLEAFKVLSYNYREPVGGALPTLLPPAIWVMIVMCAVYLWGFQKYRDFSRHL